VQGKPLAENSSVFGLLGFLGQDAALGLGLDLGEVGEKLDVVVLAGSSEETQSVSEHVVGLLAPHVAVEDLEDLLVFAVDDLGDEVVQVLFWESSLEDILDHSLNFEGSVVIVNLDVVVLSEESVLRKAPSLVERIVVCLANLCDVFNIGLDHMNQRADAGGFLNLVEELRSEEIVAGDVRSWAGINWNDNWTSKDTVSFAAALILSGLGVRGGSSVGGSS